MIEQTKFSRIREFLDMAAGAKNDHAKIESQQYFLQNLLGPAETREAKQSAFLVAASSVATAFDQASIQTTETYDSIMARIPEKECGVRHTLRKVALNLGVIDAPGWGGK